MKGLILGLLIPFTAFGTFSISSATLAADGVTVIVTMNGTYTSGSTASCFTFSGGAAPGFNTAAASVSATGGSATVTVVAAYPGYAPDTLAVSLAATPTCLMIGSTGSAASSSATLTNGSEFYAAGDAHYTSVVQYQGSPVNVTDGNGYPHSILFDSANGSLELSVTSSSGLIAVATYTGSMAITLWVDGSISTRTAVAGSPSYSTTAFGSLNTGAHVFRVALSSTAGPWRAQGFAALRCSGCAFTTKPVLRSLAGICGASVANITGGGGGTENADQSHWGLLSAAFGTIFQGASASGIDLYGVSGALEQICPADLVPYGGASPSFVFMEPDSNDVAHSISLANYQGAAQATTTAIMANAAPPAKLFWIAPNISGNINTTVGNCATSVAACYASYTTALAAGVAAAANANTVFIHTVSLPNGGPDWLNSLCAPTAGADLKSDCLHPPAATTFTMPGYGKFANRYAGIQAGQTCGASWAVTGTTSTVIPSPVSLTLTYAPCATTGASLPVWIDTITYTSSVLTDILCYGATCSTGSVVMPSSLGTNTAALTIYASTVGSRTLTPSNLPEGWVSAGTVTLTATPSGATYILIGLL